MEKSQELSSSIVQRMKQVAPLEYMEGLKLYYMTYIWFLNHLRKILWNLETSQ